LLLCISNATDTWAVRQTLLTVGIGLSCTTSCIHTTYEVHMYTYVLHIYRATQKNIPFTFVEILAVHGALETFVTMRYINLHLPYHTIPLCTFEWNFMQLLNNKLYTLSPTFVEIYLKMTNLYRFNHENPHCEVLHIMFIRIRCW